MHNRSICPLANCLDLIGDKWTLILLRDMYLGKVRYGDFLMSDEGITTNILASRLKEMIANGLIKKSLSGKTDALRIQFRPIWKRLITGSTEHV